MTGSIRSRLTAATTAVVFSVGLLLGVSTYVILRTSLNAEARKFAEHEAHELAAIIASAKTVEEFAARQEAFRGVFPEEGVIALEAWSLSGELVLRFPKGPSLGRWEHGLSEAKRGKTPVEHISIGDERALRAALLVTFGRDPRWITVAIVSRRHEDETLTQFLQVYVVCLLVTTLFAFLGSLFLVTRALEPVHLLVQDTQRIANEGPSRRLEPPPPGSELEELVRLLNAMLARVEQTIDRLQTFTAHAGHELRTPLTRMRAEIEVALLKQDPALERRALESVLEETDLQRRVLDGLLSLARDQAPLDLPQEAVVSFSELIEEIAEEAAEVGASHEVTVERQIEPGLQVRGQRALLARIPWNVINNAFQLDPPPRTVIVRMAREGDQVVVDIDDDGPGLPDDPEQLFVPFGVSSGPAKTHNGLGLPLSRGIARRHGGDLIAMKATSLSGAKFRLTLPAAG